MSDTYRAMTVDIWHDEGVGLEIKEVGDNIWLKHLDNGIDGPFPISHYFLDDVIKTLQLFQQQIKEGDNE